MKQACKYLNTNTNKNNASSVRPIKSIYFRMIYNKILIACLVLCFLQFSFKSDLANITWGTKTVYKPLQTKYSTPPAGYKPVFINYTGRHGARFQTGITSDSILYSTLKKADKENGLSRAGRKLMRMDSLLMNIEKSDISYISDRGKEEQEALGKRMAANFSNVFSVKNCSIKISTTRKERTRQSAKAFLKGLNADTTLLMVKNFNDNDELAFYDISPTYKTFKDNGNWKRIFSAISNSTKAKATYKNITQTFFTASYYLKLKQQKLSGNEANDDTSWYDDKNIATEFFEAASIVASLDLEISNKGYKPEEMDFTSLVSGDDLQYMSYINSAEDFLVKGPGTDAEGIQVRIAVPLLISFIKATEDYISKGKVIANLNFGHAETIAPFAALLGIRGASEAISAYNIVDYNKTWKCEEIIPLSANIQWVVYHNESSHDYIVKFLLNEKEVRINQLNDCGTPFYYKWNDLRDYYLHKINKMNVNLNDDIHEFLLNVK